MLSSNLQMQMIYRMLILIVLFSKWLVVMLNIYKNQKEYNYSQVVQILQNQTLPHKQLSFIKIVYSLTISSILEPMKIMVI